MASGDALPKGDEVTRWIKPKLLGRDDDGNVYVDAAGRPTEVFPEAYVLRDGEDGLSVTWLQHFGNTRAEHLPRAAEAVRKSAPSKSLQPKSAFAIGCVEEIISAGRRHGAKLRIVHEPEDENGGHTEIRRVPREPGLLHTDLAVEIFKERYLYKNVRRNGWHP